MIFQYTDASVNYDNYYMLRLGRQGDSHIKVVMCLASDIICPHDPSHEECSH